MVPCRKRPALPGDDGPAESQSDAVACRAGCLPPVETLKNMGQLLPVEAGAAVMDRQFCEQRIIRTGDGNASLSDNAFYAIF